MTAEVFESTTTDQGDDALGIRNTLSVEATSNFVGETETGLVRVDTNYKATRPGQHPVDLTLGAAVNAAAALIRATLTGYHQSDTVDAVDLLDKLGELDTEIHVLRHVLLREVQNTSADQS